MHALTLSHIIPASPISAVLLQSLFLLPPLPSPSKTRVCCVVCRARGSREVHSTSYLICRREWQYPAYNGLVAGTTMRKQHFFFGCNYFSSKFSWYFRTAWVNGHHNNLLCVSPLSITMPLPIPCTSIRPITPSAITLLTWADKEQNNKTGQVYSIVMPDTEASQCMVKSLFVLHSALSPKGWKVLSFGGNMVSESPFRLHV